MTPTIELPWIKSKQSSVKSLQRQDYKVQNCSSGFSFPIHSSLESSNCAQGCVSEQCNEKLRFNCTYYRIFWEVSYSLDYHFRIKPYSEAMIQMFYVLPI